MVTVPRRRARGFTLIELMLALTVLAILGGIAAPSVAEMLARQRLRGAAGKVINDLVRTRATAAKMERNVTIHPTVAGTNWEGGWEIDHPDPSKNDVYVQDAMTRVTIEGPTSVVYEYSGRIRGSVTPVWRISATGTDDVRCVTLELDGNPSQKSEAC